MTSPATARRLWALGEPFHALIYFTAESRQAAEDVGLTGFWNGYFAFRAAPLGVVGAPVVAASFYNFAPSFVRRRVPGVWSMVTPSQALAARLAGIDAAVRRVFGEDWLRSAEAAETAELVRIAAEAVDVVGRPLAAANTGLPEPDAPHLALWQGLTTLREHRGDGHNAALVAREIDGIGAHVLAAAAGRADRDWLIKARGWDDEAWTDGVARLTERGWLADEELTAEGSALVAGIEADTDRLALAPWQVLGDARCDRLAELLVSIRRTILAAGAWEPGNPIGVPDPE